MVLEPTLFIHLIKTWDCPECEKHVRLKITEKEDGTYRECEKCGTLIGYELKVEPSKEEARPVKRLSFWGKLRRMVRRIRKGRR